VNVYRIADLNIACSTQTAYAAAFLAAYEIAPDASVSLIVSDVKADDEASYLPEASQGVREVAALLRELARQMPSFDRLMLHAATVVCDGVAYAFIAPSGTGKTTHATLWKTALGERVHILNGDKLFVHLRDNEITAYGNPWCGKERLGYNGCAPLGGLVLLTRSERAYAEPLTPAQMLPHLLCATAFPQAQEERERVLALLETLTTSCPLYQLYAPLSTDAVKVMLTAIGGTL